MKPGKLALLRFPQVNLEEGTLRPVLLITRVLEITQTGW